MARHDDAYCQHCEEPLVSPPEERTKLYELFNLLSDGTDPAGLIADALVYLRESVAETDALTEIAATLADTLRGALMAAEADPPYPWKSGALKQQMREDLAAYDALGLEATT